MDAAHEWTDERIEELERRFADVYRQASEEMRSKLETHMALFDAENKKWQERVKSGEATKAEYDRWLYQWTTDRDFIDGLARRLAADAVNADRIAAGYINDELPSIYAENANAAAWQIEKGLGWDTHSFDLYDESTVRRLIAEDAELVRFVTPDGAEDLRWNRQKFNSAITQSVLQGESIPHTAERLQRVLGMDESAAVRSARTAMTSAENAGRIDSYKRAEAAGIELMQQWMATPDMRTRPSHIALDGEKVKVGESFKAAGGKLRYPGDPSGAPEEVYNCFTGDVLVATQHEIKRSYKHLYSGDLVTIETASGIKITCTPNHPILCGRGWIGASSLDNGDDVFVARFGDNRISRGNPDIHHGFSRIDALHELIAELGGKRACALGVDFHGDVAASEVEIVTHERLLGNDLDPSGRKRVDELFFKLADKPCAFKSAFREHFLRVRFAALRLVSRLRKTFPFFWRACAHSDEHGLRPVALCYPSVVETSDDCPPGYAELLGECLHGFAGIVFVDKIINIYITSDSAHVYNLQTEHGYYFVNASIPERGRKHNDIMGIVAKNCRCTLVPWLPGIEQEDPERWTRLPDGITYEEWKNGKQKPVVPDKAQVGNSNVVNGKDILGTWERREDEFEFEIEDVINAQGFDGKPRIVGADEFDKAVKQANGGNGLIMQRSYSAPDQETLDSYRNMLYDGKWYVDCSTGGAQYGQGMYVAADYSGNLTEGLRDEMQHYTQLGRDRNPLTPDEKKTLHDARDRELAGIKKDPRFSFTDEERAAILDFDLDEPSELSESLKRTGKFDDAYARAHAKSAEREKVKTELPLMSDWELAERYPDIVGQRTYIETMTLDPTAKIIEFNDIPKAKRAAIDEVYARVQGSVESRMIRESGDPDIVRYAENMASKDNERMGDARWWLRMDATKEQREFLERVASESNRLAEETSRPIMSMDAGSFAAAYGYDAINAVGHGASGSYTVVLNRTKLIIRRP